MKAACKDCGCTWDVRHGDKLECPYCKSTNVEVLKDD